ncbi:MAG: Stage II sporulation protein R [Thermoanaerobacterales bacterium 50_218]|nr:MAG: Stage II sporulation protein R [Thermoanaerobacterales bacterium 50_218]
MKKRWAFTVLGILIIVFLGMIGLAGAGQSVEAYNPHNLIRFHIIPNSNTEADQVLKLRVRDAVVRYLTPEVQDVQDVREARRIVLNDLDRIRAIARREVQTAGKDYPVQVTFGRYYFPVRTYGSLKVPEGDYQAVRIVIGEGKGQNWWCVLFPPLCFVSAEAAAETPALASGNKEMLGQGAGQEVQLQWRIREWWEKSNHLVDVIAERLNGKEKRS